jgi:hypothetical protein
MEKFEEGSIVERRVFDEGDMLPNHTVRVRVLRCGEGIALVENLDKYRGWCWDGRSKVPEFKGRKDWVLLEYLREATGRWIT